MKYEPEIVAAAEYVRKIANGKKIETEKEEIAQMLEQLVEANGKSEGGSVEIECVSRPNHRVEKASIIRLVQHCHAGLASISISKHQLHNKNKMGRWENKAFI